MVIDISITPRDWQSSGGDSETALLRALERSVRSRWRVVCPNILVECIEPYRTLVLHNEAVQNLREQQMLAQQHINGTSPYGIDEPFQVSAELHTPLAGS
jgi:hypothetical protein